jgi:hypothetical protein
VAAREPEAAGPACALPGMCTRCGELSDGIPKYGQHHERDGRGAGFGLIRRWPRPHQNGGRPAIGPSRGHGGQELPIACLRPARDRGGYRDPRYGSAEGRDGGKGWPYPRVSGLRGRFMPSAKDEGCPRRRPAQRFPPLTAFPLALVLSGTTARAAPVTAPTAAPGAISLRTSLVDLDALPDPLSDFASF